MSKFIYIDGDESSSLFEKTLIGRITKNRYKILSSYVRKKSYSEHCGCVHDCCGCLFAVYYDLKISNNKVVIQMIESRNY